MTFFYQSQGHHKHHPEANESLEHSLHGDDEDSLKPVWTGLTVLGGVYVMFLIEHFLPLAKMYKDKKQKVRRTNRWSDKYTCACVRACTQWIELIAGLSDKLQYIYNV